MSYYPHLFSPIKIGNFTFRNRIFDTPHGANHYTATGAPTEMEIAYFECKARGGAAQVTVGETPVDERYLNQRKWYLLNINNPVNMVALKSLTRSIKLHGAAASIELTHGGMYCSHEAMEGRHPIGPMGLTLANGTIVDPMDEDMIEEAIESYARAALIAKSAGFDMAMIHGGHGWLLTQFLSERTNKRHDKYGGTFEKRARFPIEVLERVRKKVGPDFLLEYRISGDELTNDGMKIDQVVEFVKMIEDKIDLVHVSVGSHDPGYPNSMYPYALSRMFPPAGFTEHGCNVYLAEAMKKAVKIPVVTVGGISSPELAEKILAEGRADIIGMCRALIADPEFPNKARQGRRKDIRTCLRCEECNIVGGCSVNPESGSELHWKFIPKPDASRKVLVIGGGPGGMHAAITAAQRGHKVTLIEKTDKLGGLLNTADFDPMKGDLKAYKNYLIYQTNLVADVRLNTEATPELVEKEAADVVIAAVGSEPIVPNVPGISGKSTMSAMEAYYNLDKVGNKVAIIGGGILGADLALLLANRGKTVKLVEMNTERYPRKTLGWPFDSQYYIDVQEYDLGDDNWRHGIPLNYALKELPNFSYQKGTKCTEITTEGIKVVGKDGNEQFIEADTVIYAVGMKSKSDTVEKLRSSAINFYPIGDCVVPKKILNAVESAHMIVMDIK